MFVVAPALLLRPGTGVVVEVKADTAGQKQSNAAAARVIDGVFILVLLCFSPLFFYGPLMNEPQDEPFPLIAIAEFGSLLWVVGVLVNC